MKKALIILSVLLIIGLGYGIYNMVDNQKSQQNDTISYLQEQLAELQEQLSGTQIDDTEIEISLPEVMSISTGTDVSASTGTISTGNTSSNNTQPQNTGNNTQSTTQQTPTPPTIIPQESSVVPTIIPPIGFENLRESCPWTNQGRLNQNYFDAAKVVNAKLQSVRDSNQANLQDTINDAQFNINNSQNNLISRCTYSWVIHALRNQPGYIASHTTNNGTTYLNIDFISYVDIASEHPIPAFRTKNTSKRTRSYRLSSIPMLATLYTDNAGFSHFTANNKPAIHYTNNFSDWLSSFCNNEPIYNINEPGINFNAPGRGPQCLRDHLGSKDGGPYMYFSFLDLEVKEINTSAARWRISSAEGEFISDLP